MMPFRNHMRATRHLRTLAIVFLTACGSITAMAQSGKPVEIEYGFPESPPLSFTNAQGESEGMLVRLASALFTKAGVSWRAVGYPAARLFSNLADGSTNFAILVNSPTISDCCIISKTPVFVHELRAYYLGNKPPIKEKSDLVGKSVITIRGYTYGGFMKFVTDEKNRITNNTAANHRTAFEMLDAGRADYLLNYGVNAPEALAPDQLAKLKYDTIGYFDIFLVVSKKHPNAEQFMAKLESILKTLDKEQIFKSAK